MSENTRKEPQPTEHGFIVKARAHVEIRGMTEVLSFDENSVSLATTSGNMIIEGRDLRVGVLDVKEGTVAVELGDHVDVSQNVGFFLRHRSHRGKISFQQRRHVAAEHLIPAGT